MAVLFYEIKTTKLFIVCLFLNTFDVCQQRFFFNFSTPWPIFGGLNIKINIKVDIVLRAMVKTEDVNAEVALSVNYIALLVVFFL